MRGEPSFWKGRVASGTPHKLPSFWESAVYISKMTDIDVKVLEQLLKKSVAASKKQHG